MANRRNKNRRQSSEAVMYKRLTNMTPEILPVISHRSTIAVEEEEQALARLKILKQKQRYSTRPDQWIEHIKGKEVKNSPTWPRSNFCPNLGPTIQSFRTFRGAILTYTVYFVNFKEHKMAAHHGYPKLNH